MAGTGKLERLPAITVNAAANYGLALAASPFYLPGAITGFSPDGEKRCDQFGIDLDFRVRENRRPLYPRRVAGRCKASRG